MENKMTIEELEKEYADINKKRNHIGKVLSELKKAKEEQRKADLAAEKNQRKKEVDESVNNAVKLIQKYIEDYGSYSIKDNSNDLSSLFNLVNLRWFL